MGATRAVLVLALAAAAGLSAEETFEQTAARAAEARDARRWDEAVEAYREGLSRRPDWAEGGWFLAATLFEAGRHAEAVEAFERFTATAPDVGAGWILLGVNEYKIGRYDAALEHLRRGRALGANDDLLASTDYHLAVLLNRQGEFEAAAQLLQSFADKNVRAPSVIAAFGLAALRQRRLPGEIPADCRERVERAGRAAFHSAAREVATARELMEALAADYPDDADVRYAYGALLVEADPAAAEAEFRRALAADAGDYHANLALGALLAKQRRDEEALRALETARAARPDSLPARYQTATVKLAMGETDDARRLLETIVVEAPNFVGARVSLASAYRRLGRMADAERESEAVRRLNAERQAAEPGAIRAREMAP